MCLTSFEKKEKLELSFYAKNIKILFKYFSMKDLAPILYCL